MRTAPLVSSTYSSTHAESFNLIPSIVPEAFLIRLLDSLCGHSVFQFSLNFPKMFRLNTLSESSPKLLRSILPQKPFMLTMGVEGGVPAPSRTPAATSNFFYIVYGWLCV
jgi:hypothetical protein